MSYSRTYDNRDSRYGDNQRTYNNRDSRYGDSRPTYNNRDSRYGNRDSRYAERPRTYNNVIKRTQTNSKLQDTRSQNRFDTLSNVQESDLKVLKKKDQPKPKIVKPTEVSGCWGNSTAVTQIKEHAKKPITKLRYPPKSKATSPTMRSSGKNLHFMQVDKYEYSQVTYKDVSDEEDEY